MNDTKLPPEVREAARDVEAYCWGSLDVSREDVLAHFRALAPEAVAQLQGVMKEQVKASRVRQRRCERRALAHQLSAKVLRLLMKRLKP
jgi:hypothetical protein